jgi:hypothetical protein
MPQVDRLRGVSCRGGAPAAEVWDAVSTIGVLKILLVKCHVSGPSGVLRM